ncbi:NAD-dependent epimerase/dehydratase family protein [Jidongwangia harbinensis]|uniref:NAD-dependent epimerase/dehydratase family protein n=1 Tax=Jidongwangia harbinensis TaxID=2878561 RepID=UPI001CDA1D0C|nr:NAD(P)-dependent oxidoreductase [Jidongwangia harbinensis]MCA2211505.1 NAD(P)-dependent oxidoreductase [Jidongwangia harbinensis]
MILVTGGAGFIGSHTTRALAESGQECVLVQRRSPEVPAHLAGLPVHAVRADLADLDALLAVGKQYPITGIVHLAVTLPGPDTGTDPIDASARTLEQFLNVVRAGRAWGVRRIVTASTIGVYGFDNTGALTESMPLSLDHTHAIPTFKKIFELLAGHLSAETSVEIVNARIAGIWGPGGHLPDPFFVTSTLVHAAARHREPDLSGFRTPPSAEDALDLLYARDAGRALALLQLADGLQHSTYNVASGRATSNAEVIAAIRAVEPGFRFALPAAGERPRTWLDIGRLRADTGFEPRYDIAAGVADYIAWFRAGNER